MLSLQHSNRVTFNVNVFGTAATPSVRCIVGETPALSFPALKLKDSEWEVMIDLPSDMKSGAQPFKVEVVLNGRLFTPIQTSIDVQAPSPAEGPVVAAPAITPPPVAQMTSAPEPAPAPAPAIVDLPEPEPEPEPEPVVPKKTVSLDLMASLAPRIDAEVTPREHLPEAPATTLTGLAALVKAPVQKLPPRVTQEAAAPEIKSIKISMLEIANQAAKTDKPAKKPKAAQAKIVAEHKSIPVRLIKGDIIYR